MTAINAKLAYPLSLREQRDPDPRSASGSYPSQDCVTSEIDWGRAGELDKAIRPICLAFPAEVRVPGCARRA
jgi:hypothetical protein